MIGLVLELVSVEIDLPIHVGYAMRTLHDLI